MIIVRFTGGLGNQMYIYAICCILEQLYPHQSIKADIEHYRLYKVHNGFEIDDCFQANILKASRKEIHRLSPRFTSPFLLNGIPAGIVNILERNTFKLRKKGKKKRNYIVLAPHNKYDIKVIQGLREGEDYYLDAMWQNVRYFEGYEGLIKEKMKFRKAVCGEKDLEILREIRDTQSVSIHLRRGDYVDSKGHDLCGESYYLNAIHILMEKVPDSHWFVFSDDIEYAKIFLKDTDAKYIYHTREEGSVDMYMMSCCKHNIIANSTFSFWAAFLNDNPDKIVVCPKYFYRDGDRLCDFSVPEQWIKIKNAD